jgi:hypothetical protein
MLQLHNMSVPGMSDMARPRLLDNFFKSPNEIIVQILAELDYRDLLALRRADRAFHTLVHTHECALAQKQAESCRYEDILGDALLFANNDLAQIVELSIRVEVTTKLALMMGERIASKLTFRHTPFSEDELETWKAKKATRLASVFRPAMFVLYDFFVQLRTTIFDVAEKFKFLSDEDYLELGRVFELDQQYMIEHVRPDALVDITEAWRALTGLCSAKGLAMYHHGRLTSAATIRSHLAYGDFYTFAAVICKTDYTSGPIKLNTLISEIWGKDVADDAQRGSFTRPLETIHHLRCTRSMTKTKLTNVRRKETQMRLIEAQPFWEKPAIAVMQRRGLVGKIDPHLPTIETWLRGVISEKGDPWFEFGRWSRPDTAVP